MQVAYSYSQTLHILLSYYHCLKSSTLTRIKTFDPPCFGRNDYHYFHIVFVHMSIRTGKAKRLAWWVTKFARLDQFLCFNVLWFFVDLPVISQRSLIDLCQKQQLDQLNRSVVFNKAKDRQTGIGRLVRPRCVFLFLNRWK